MAENDDFDEDDIDLNALPDDELVEQMQDDLYDGLKEEVIEGTEILLKRGWKADKVLTEALVGGMTIVGVDFRDGILFVPEVLSSANAMKGGMAILKPLLSATDDSRAGKMVIGTVKGDIHDIGKNLVRMMNAILAREIRIILKPMICSYRGRFLLIASQKRVALSAQSAPGTFAVT